MNLTPTRLISKKPVAFGFLLALVAATGFSSKAIFIKLAYVYAVDPLTLLTLRMSFALPFFSFILMMLNRKKPNVTLPFKTYAMIVVLGFMGYYLSSLFDFMGLIYISASLERLILFLYPSFTVLLSFFILKKRLNRNTLLVLCLAYAGIGISIGGELTTTGQNVLLGSVLVFIATLTYSLYLVGSEKLIAEIGANRFTSIAMIASSIAVIIHFLIAQDFATLNQPTMVYAYAFAITIFSTLIPAYSLALAIKLIGAANTAIVGTAGPVITIFFAFIFLCEPITIFQITGGALVIYSIVKLKKSK